MTGSIMPLMGKSPKLAEGVFIADSARVVGDVEIGRDSSIWPFVSARGDMHSIRIGERTSIQDNTVLHITHSGPFNEAGWPLTIGDDVTVGHSATLHGCTIGNRVLIGIGSIVLDGAVVEDNVVLGAGSLVPPKKHLPGGYLYVGSPCKPLRKLSDSELSFFQYSANNYVKLKDQYLKEGCML